MYVIEKMQGASLQMVIIVHNSFAKSIVAKKHYVIIFNIEQSSVVVFMSLKIRSDLNSCRFF